MIGKILLTVMLFLCLVLISQPVVGQTVRTGVSVDTQTIVTESSSSLFEQFDIAGNPTRLAVENSGRVWVTLPEIDAIGVISVTGVVSQTTSYLVRTYFLESGSHPYDLDFDENTVWFTAYGSNEIGRLDPVTDEIKTYDLPDIDSGPTGIQVAADGIVWFTQQKANSLSKYDPSSGAFQSYPYTLANGGLESVATVKPGSVWVTAPNVNRIANFNPEKNAFISIPTLPYTRPTGLALEGGDVPWVSVTGGNRIGRYAPGTLTFWRWTPLPGSGDGVSGSKRIALSEDSGPKGLFYADELMQKIGLVEISSDTAIGRVREAQAPGNACTPLDIQVSSDGSAWFTCGAANKVVRWVPPYFFNIYAPMIAR